jgi:hypothetical protein
MAGKRRNFTQLKAQLVLQALEGHKTQAEICRAYQIALLSSLNGKQTFSSKPIASSRATSSIQVKRDFLSRKLGGRGGPITVTNSKQERHH